MHLARGCNKKPTQGRFDNLLLCMVATGGLEPPTPALWALCTNQLGYVTIKRSSPRGIRLEYTGAIDHKQDDH